MVPLVYFAGPHKNQKSNLSLPFLNDSNYAIYRLWIAKSREDLNSSSHAPYFEKNVIEKVYSDLNIFWIFYLFSSASWNLDALSLLIYVARATQSRCSEAFIQPYCSNVGGSSHTITHCSLLRKFVVVLVII